MKERERGAREREKYQETCTFVRVFLLFGHANEFLAMIAQLTARILYHLVNLLLLANAIHLDVNIQTRTCSTFSQSLYTRIPLEYKAAPDAAARLHDYYITRKKRAKTDLFLIPFYSAMGL